MKKVIFIFVLCLLTTFAFAQKESQRKALFNLDKSVAIQGYDPVAYFTKSKALKGKKEFTTDYKGVIYYFVTVGNKELFLKNPIKYEPGYGGWCAYAMGLSGEKVSVDPSTFKVLDGKLYLFYNAFFNNTLKDWNKDEAKLKLKADGNWTKITQ
ncbi:YHS domain-containing (seleno)protein [Flavobacterium sp. 7A]|uniref:YHS domain-containing (seleno)protein n=1 Tax=Flavobacterium sp. 7A TaxID=2940571 RepID=UPI002227456F|nr:YHS domain-containing (seleno)protein [Flavobacterium sp. 7A]MCW2117815.1 YHS domain-containing protein [Flavobacterium sp. 7A]